MTGQPKTPQEENSSNELTARYTALNILDNILTRKTALDQCLDRNDDFKSLPARDKAFARMIIATTLRRLGQIDEIIKKSITNPTTTNALLKNILRLGTTQILFMDVPDHAAVNTSVKLAEQHRMDRQKAFVNGVLRNISRIGKDLVSKQDETRLNTPEWLLKLWIEDYGLKTAAKISQAHHHEAALDITIKDEASRNHWAAEFTASQIACGSLRCRASGSITDLPGFDDGAWWIQDASAAIPANLFGNIEGQTVIDLCAAPGGKTMQLAAQGAHVIAIDRSANRMKRLHENLERIQLTENVETITSDATQWSAQQAPKFILLDAPCSATGTIRRHPDVPHLKSPRDIEGLISIQSRILQNAFKILAPGGVLVYCTCSLQKSEGEEQIAKFLDENPNAAKRAITAEEIGGLDECITENGDIRIFPFHQSATGGMDGFFISRIVKS